MSRLLSFIVLLVTSSFAHAYNISNFGPAETNGGAAGFAVDGFQFTFSQDAPISEPHYLVSSDGDILAFCPDCDAAMERVDGSLFWFRELEVGSFLGSDADGEMIVRGFQDGGNILEQTIVMDAQQIHFFDDQWVDLYRVEFISLSPDATMILRVADIPLPAAAWLFLSALGLLGFRRRVSL